MLLSELSIFLFAFIIFMPLPRLSALLIISAVLMPMPSLSNFLSISTMFIPMLELFAPLFRSSISLSSSAMLGPKLYFLPFFI